jgi:2'-5' RNA ligase
MLSPTETDAPLILTLRLDDASFAFFNELRQQHFPPERNFLAAHVTLFHHLPGSQLAELSAALAEHCRTQPPLPLRVSSLRFMGAGVAYNLENADLQRLHRALQARWQAYLTRQDQQTLRPHVTVQNKVTPAAARALLEQLTATFEPFEATGTGLQLWAYRGGPWQALREFDFAG